MRLDLSFCDIGDEGTASLAAGLGECERLKSLSLPANRISDAGAAALAEAFGRRGALPHLKELDLGANGISVQGAEALARALWRSQELQRITLRSNAIRLSESAAFARALVGLPYGASVDLFMNPGDSARLLKDSEESMRSCQRVIAFLAGALASMRVEGAGETGSGSVGAAGGGGGESVPRVVRRDGDGAVMHKVLRWLVG